MCSKIRLLRIVTMGLLVGLALVQTAVAADSLEVHVGRTVEITSSHRYCWFPTVHQFPDGEIIVTMQMSPDEINPEGEFTAYCRSKDGGTSWSQRYTMGPGASADGAYTSAPQPDGTILQLHNYPIAEPDGQSRQFRVAETKFLRGGMEVQQVRDGATIHLAEPGLMADVSLFDRETSDGQVKKQIRGMPWGVIIPALNGNLLAPMYYLTAKDSRYYRTVLLRSGDGGKTWNEDSMIAGLEPGAPAWPWMGSEGPCELGLVRLADDRLYAAFRTSGDGEVGQTWSSDDGKTWSQPVAAGFKGVAIRVKRLSNGMLALTTGRPGPVVIMFSADGTGKEWTQVTPIYTGMSTRYTDLIELSPGKLLVVYDSVPYGWHEIPYTDRKARNVIYGTFVDVRKR